MFKDIDECKLNTHRCPQGYVCQNVIGSFKCEPQKCMPGSTFNFNKGICVPIVCLNGFKLNITINKCIGRALKR